MFLKTQKIWIPPRPVGHLRIPPVAISSDGDKQSAYQSSGAHTHTQLPQNSIIFYQPASWTHD